MCAQWLNDYHPEIVLNKFEAAKVDAGGGKVSYHLSLFDDFLELLISSIKFRSHLPKTTIKGIVLKSLFEIPLAEKLSPGIVLKRISKLEQQYLQQSPKKFFISGSVSIKSRKRISSIKTTQGAIQFDKAIPKPILEAEPKYRRIFMQAVKPEFPQGYARFTVAALGRSIHEAGQSGLEDFDFYRALWNLRLNVGEISRSSSGRISPINRIVMGPLNTIFTEDFKLIEETWWQVPDYDQAENAHDVTDVWKVLRSFERYARGKIKGSTWGGLIRTVLIIYVNALDKRDYEAAFLKLWCALEMLTLTERANYDVTIRRASFYWEDHDFHREVLYHLKESRNRSVHRDEFGIRGEVLVYQLKRYVETLLIFYITKGRYYRNLQEIASFLDLPTNLTALQDRDRLLKKAIAFRTPKKKK